MKKVFCFGELLLRLSPATGGEWIPQASLPVFVGGAELNVATALSRWNIPVKYATVLPDHYLSQDIIADLQSKRIDTSAILFAGQRIGLYYLSQGADLKHTSVIYDRAHSSFSSLLPGQIDWDAALKDCNWFHFSAISPALNESVAAVCLEGLEAASAKGLTISVDLNYRSKLWQYGKQPVQIMPQLVAYADVIMGNIWAAEALLGIHCPIADSRHQSPEMLVNAAQKSMQDIHSAYPNANTIAFTFRLDDHYFAVLRQAGAITVSKTFALQSIVDKIGSGDCFMGGLIYGLHEHQPPQAIIDFAAAAAVGKMKETGDSTHQSVESVHKIVTTAWTTTNPS